MDYKIGLKMNRRDKIKNNFRKYGLNYFYLESNLNLKRRDKINLVKMVTELNIICYDINGNKFEFMMELRNNDYVVGLETCIILN